MDLLPAQHNTGAGTHPSERPLQDLAHLKGQNPAGHREGLYGSGGGGEWWVEPAQPPLGALVGGYCKGWGFFLAAKRAELEVEDLRPWWNDLPVALILGMMGGA